MKTALSKVLLVLALPFAAMADIYDDAAANAARSGTGSSEAGSLHRIDPAFARSDFEAHGYAFVRSSSVLENTTDDMTKSVFDPAVQGSTSRFIYKFTRP
jgi:predicted methyltransferase